MNTSAQTIPDQLIEDAEMIDALARSDVHSMSAAIFNARYEDIQGVLYPNPRYKIFHKKKRNGSLRVIREPRRRLKSLQLKLLAYLQARAGKPKPCAQAFINKRSIVTNARKHLERRPTFILNIDLENFFPSITFYRVRGVLQKPPFNFSHEVATVLAQMCVVGNELPQGAPTSPFLSNQVCRSLDRDLMDLAKRHQAVYTRYADDITFSFSRATSATLPANICTFDSGEVTLGNELIAIIGRHNFQINPTKTRMSTRWRRMEVTGIVVNEFPNLKRNFIDRIRGALHAWERYGYAAAQESWESRIATSDSLDYEKRPWKRQTRTGEPPALKNVLWGKLLFVRMVRGDDDAIYTRLAEKYNELVTQESIRESSFSAPGLPVEQIVRNLQDVERAVFIVEWHGDFHLPGSAQSELIMSQGTAFAYKRQNRLITCNHVLTGTAIVNGDSHEVDIDSQHLREVSLTVRDPITWTEWKVRVVHRDVPRDLAILEFYEQLPAHRYFAGRDSPIVQHSTGHLIGFPNWSPGRHANIEPALVTARFPRSALSRIDINQLIRRGNSGGPYVDELFRVAGVAQKGATQEDGNNECLCVSELDAWISKYESSLRAHGADTIAEPENADEALNVK